MACYTANTIKDKAAAIVEVLEDIAYMSNSQDQLTDNLTILRNAAKVTNQLELFNKCYETARNGGINPEDMNGLEWRFHYSLFDFTESEDPYREVRMQRV